MRVPRTSLRPVPDVAQTVAEPAAPGAASSGDGQRSQDLLVQWDPEKGLESSTEASGEIQNDPLRSVDAALSVCDREQIRRNIRRTFIDAAIVTSAWPSAAPVAFTKPHSWT